uniref:DDE Tnp4 domain-containing protein n=1 Tax=Amphimedon queenslandica TaxID=400682 RepID=A0A1X7UC36_AMPQE
FPHCIGALDGKNVLIRPPPNSVSYYINYKHTFSIVLIALVDADYKFTYVNIGCNGRISDGGVYGNSSLCSALESNTLNIPCPTPLSNDKIPLPYLIVADDAFPLEPYIQKPYGQVRLTKKKRIFNYRLSRARRIVENAFGILANRFQVLMNPLRLAPEKAEVVVLACYLLHNFFAIIIITQYLFTTRQLRHRRFRYT